LRDSHNALEMARPEEIADYYALLSISATASESEIRRAYRKTSLLYHPDKVTPTPETLDKFQLLQTALNILTDAGERAKYDQKREAKLRRKVEEDKLGERRRKLKDDLESREGVTINGVNGMGVGMKRNWSQRELEINRIKEENRQRREAAMGRKVDEVRERERKEEEERKVKEKQVEGKTQAVERSIKVRWVKEGEGLEIDAEALEESFPTGEVESVVILKDKKRRVEGREKKVVMGTAVIIFATIAAAKRVVAKGRWEGIESVGWAAEKEKESDPL
jgi:DnaJ homolog subfamily C member 17